MIHAVIANVIAAAKWIGLIIIAKQVNCIAVIIYAIWEYFIVGARVV